MQYSTEQESGLAKCSLLNIYKQNMIIIYIMHKNSNHFIVMINMHMGLTQAHPHYNSAQTTIA